MKFLVFILAMAISAQPLQAGVCDMDMEKDQPMPQQMDQMADGMEHSDTQKHDCCDTDESEPQSECDGMMHCGSCHASFSDLPAILKFDTRWTSNYSPVLSSDTTLPGYPSRPYRPPIA